MNILIRRGSSFFWLSLLGLLAVSWGLAQNDVPIPKQIQPIAEDAKRGDPKAESALATFYENRKAYSKAVEWYRKAAEQGDTLGQFGLGRAYFLGQGVEPDDIEAYT